VLLKKKWSKPVVFTLTKEELKKHIRVAARSGHGCIQGNAR